MISCSCWWRLPVSMHSRACDIRTVKCFLLRLLSSVPLDNNSYLKFTFQYQCTMIAFVIALWNIKLMICWLIIKTSPKYFFIYYLVFCCSCLHFTKYSWNCTIVLFIVKWLIDVNKYSTYIRGWSSKYVIMTYK